jgi:hypothetical protein
MGKTKELFMQMAQGFMEGVNIEKELRGRMADDQYQYTIYKNNRNKKTKRHENGTIRSRNKMVG